MTQTPSDTTTGTTVPLYQVLNISPMPTFDAAGNSVDGYHIVFNVAGAGDQSMDIPETGATDTSIEDAIIERVKLLVSILEIVGPQVQLDQYGHPIMSTATATGP